MPAPSKTRPVESQLEELAREVARCRRCPLHKTRKHVVVYRGSPSPRVLFVGEAPGEEEDLLGRPFVGRSGKILDQAIAQTGLTEGEYGVLNVVKCRPPGNRFLREAATKCRPYLERQLSLLNPQVVVPLGAHALYAFLPTGGKITELAGRSFDSDGRAVFPMLHPAAMLHSPGLRERWERDVRTLGGFLASGPR
ncbi:MAG: uracil-DNA glycosylase [Thermoplasmata archaeon]|nr:uracil-DNA glycosylase [Thermoplasmata archaeon]